jgi:ABC-type polysaccharide/polyol phosphate export permease
LNPVRYAAGFLASLAAMRGVILRLAANDFRRRYLGSAFGAAWAVIPTLATIAVFWFVFVVGFKTVPAGNHPFIVYFVTALVPWTFLAEAIQRGSSAITENAYMVRKVRFRAGILPLTAILPTAAVHLVFVAVLALFLMAYGYAPGWHWLQLPYFAACGLVLSLGVAWACSAIVVFFKDLEQIIGLGLQVFFWLTPIVWPREILPQSLTWIFTANPATYVTEGYRDALINQRWFWERPVESAVFWTLATAGLVVGAVVFRRLRPHFADVLA